jgi:hypothetical protein
MVDKNYMAFSATNSYIALLYLTNATAIFNT